MIYCRNNNNINPTFIMICVAPLLALFVMIESAVLLCYKQRRSCDIINLANAQNTIFGGNDQNKRIGHYLVFMCYLKY